MTLTVCLPPEKEQRLQERARAHGQDVITYVQQLIDRDLATPPETVEEILAPLRQEFDESGMTDEELDALVEEAREEVWREKQAGKAP